MLDLTALNDDRETIEIRVEADKIDVIEKIAAHMGLSVSDTIFELCLEYGLRSGALPRPRRLLKMMEPIPLPDPPFVRSA